MAGAARNKRSMHASILSLSAWDQRRACAFDFSTSYTARPYKPPCSAHQLSAPSAPLAKSSCRPAPTNNQHRMLMTAAVHMDSTSPTLPWFPVPAGNHRLPYDFTASAPSPTPATATVTAAPPNHHQHRPARRMAKRRPRPSRKLPTTYITADPASFRRMVHQVTGADDLPVPPETLCRPPPYRAGAGSSASPTSAVMLPTLDTSAFLLGAPGADGPAGSARTPTPGLDRRPEAGGACNYSSNSNSGSSCGGGGGFPTLDSWDALL